ncbi:MAG: nuclear transport factor 2 family protein [Acidobacteriaceae bacterium]
MPPTAEALIRAARARSNRGIAERNAHMVAESLDKDFVVIIGDGTFVPSRDAYLALFKQDFANPTHSLRYERIPDTIDVSTADPLAAEHGHWIGFTSTGATAYTGTYSAMWRRTPSGWKLRSELFVTLAKANSD